MSKNSIIAVVVVAALAAGTVLVAGYVDGPKQSVQVTAESPCGGCPKAATADCPKADDCCGKTEACPIAAQQSACEAKSAAGCCPGQAAAASCPVMGSEVQIESPCGAGAAGGCPHAE